MITMRDGVRLYTEYFVPKSIKEPLPIIFMRTPYGITGWFERGAGGFLKELVDEGYIFAFRASSGRRLGLLGERPAALLPSCVPHTASKHRVIVG